MNFPIVKDTRRFIMPEHPVLLPDTPDYINYWRDVKRKCVDGYWSESEADGGFRWITPNLFFYVNAGTILRNPEAEVGGSVIQAKRPMRPLLRDVDWEMGYSWIECRGLSGFEKDEKYTCNQIINKYSKEDLLSDSLYKYAWDCFDSKGNLKEYIPPREYIRMVREADLGRPIYNNQAQDLFILGSRGFGKSYFVANCVLLHEFLIDGARRYDRDAPTNKIELFIGAAQASKSNDTLEKFRLAFDNLPGAYYDKLNDLYYPSPLSKTVTGSLSSASKNTFRNEYRKKLGNTWLTSGTGTSLKHAVYKPDNPQAAVGTRPTTMAIEEVGLLANVLDVHASNVTCMEGDEGKFGSAIYIGTGGNMEKIRGSEIIFRNPGGYNFLSFKNTYETNGRDIGLFVPYHYCLNNLKDKNGNTNIELASKIINERRQKLKDNTANRSALDGELMNNPIVPKEMFLNTKGNIFPIAELQDRYDQLTLTHEESLSSLPVTLYFDPKAPNGVSYKPDQENKLNPINRFPVKENRNDLEGAVVMYEKPLRKNGEVPEGLYIISVDPYATDGETGSLGSMFVFKTGKLRMDGFGYHEIVAEYTARPAQGRNEFNRQIEMAAMLYNVGKAGIFVEVDRGNVVEYFAKRNKLHMIAPEPKILLGSTIQTSRAVRYGYRIKSRENKLRVLGYLRDFLIEERTSMGIDPTTDEYKSLLNLHVIKSPALLQELINFDLDGNFDRVMAACGFVIGIRMRENELEEQLYKQQKSEIYSFFQRNKHGKSERNPYKTKKGAIYRKGW